MPKLKKKKSIYGVHPGIKMTADWIASLPEKTGKSLEQWLALARRDGPDDEKALREWLKDKHGHGTNTAWWLAEHALGKGGAWDYDDDACLKKADEYVAEQYAAGKASLKPLYDRLLEVAAELGDDVKACPCKTIVPLYRKHVFAQFKPTTRTRLDLGLALAKFDGKLPKRLIDTGGKEKKDRITHRFALGKLDEIDDEVTEWLRVAYDLDR
jgi:hypothetical protein